MTPADPDDIDWGPLAVIDEEALGYLDANVADGRLEISDGCLLIVGRGQADAVTPIWRHSQVFWDGGSQRITFDNDPYHPGGEIVVEDGMRVTAGGRSGGPASAAWIQQPDESCPANEATIHSLTLVDADGRRIDGSTCEPAADITPVDPASIQPLSHEEGLRANAETIASQLGIPVEEALRRLELQQPFARLANQLRRQFRGQVAGSFIEHEPEFGLFVRFKGPVPDGAQEIAADFSPDVVLLGGGRYNGGQLRRLSEKLTAALQDLGSTNFAVGYSGARQDVTGDVDPPPELDHLTQDELLALLPAELRIPEVRVLFYGVEGGIESDGQGAGDVNCPGSP